MLKCKSTGNFVKKQVRFIIGGEGRLTVKNFQLYVKSLQTGVKMYNK